VSDRGSGRIITFYSYKGGTGRTMALANTACLLARRLTPEASPPLEKPRVVVIDWDFEAPGLHRYFEPYFTPAAAQAFDEAPGCLDLFLALDESRAAYVSNDFVGNRQRAREALANMDFDRFLLKTTIPGLAVVKSGRYDEDYARRVAQFAWDKFFRDTVGLFTGFADFLRGRFDYAFVDSRTGVTDISGICTMLLPDKLVVVFTPNHQSFTGIRELVGKAVAYRKGSPDGRPLTVFPLPSRIEMARPQLFEEWRGLRADPQGPKPVQPTAPKREMSGYQPLFEALTAENFGLEVDLTEYFNEVSLQHVPDYAYGEPIAVELETSDSRIFLRRSYEAFVERLVELDAPWQSLTVVREGLAIQGRCREAREKLEHGAVEEALRIAYALLERKPPPAVFEEVADTLIAVATKAFPGARATASSLIRSAVELADRQEDIDATLLAETFREAGELCLRFGDYETAVRLFQESRSRSGQALGTEHPATLSAMAGLGNALSSLGRYDEARAMQERVLELRRRVLGEEHPDTLTAINNLALTLKAQGDLNEARAMQERVLELRRRVLGEEHPDTLGAMSNLAMVFAAMGENKKAEELLGHAAKVREKKEK